MKRARFWRIALFFILLSPWWGTAAPLVARRRRASPGRRSPAANVVLAHDAESGAAASLRRGSRAALSRCRSRRLPRGGCTRRVALPSLRRTSRTGWERKGRRIPARGERCHRAADGSRTRLPRVRAPRSSHRRSRSCSRLAGSCTRGGRRPPGGILEERPEPSRRARCTRRPGEARMSRPEGALDRTKRTARPRDARAHPRFTPSAASIAPTIVP
jgi:hypothetical protein